MSGRTSVQLASEHNLRIVSVSLLGGYGFATVFVCGNVFFKLSNPYAIATSSMMSHSCKMSGRVGGTCTWISSSGAMTRCGWAFKAAKFGLCVGAFAVWPILRSRTRMSSRGRFRPVHELMYEARATNGRDVSGGERTVRAPPTQPASYATLTGSMLWQVGGGRDRVSRLNGTGSLRETALDVHERLRAVLGEHGHDHVDDDFELGQIRSRNVDEDVGRVEGDFGVVRVDLETLRSQLRRMGQARLVRYVRSEASRGPGEKNRR